MMHPIPAPTPDMYTKADACSELPDKRTSHSYFMHPTKPGIITIPEYPGNIEPWALKNIEKHSGIRMD